MNNLRDPFSIRAKPGLPFQILRQPIITQTFTTISSEAQKAASTISSEAQKAASHISPAVESAVSAVTEKVSDATDAMSGFQIPKNVPSFTSSQRDLEDKVWAAAFGKKKDLPLYKDKPYYSKANGVHSRRRTMRRKRVFLGLGLVLLAGWWFGLFSRGIGRSDKSEVDWERRRQQVKQVMKESWKAYESDAWGMNSIDALLPLAMMNNANPTSIHQASISITRAARMVRIWYPAASVGSLSIPSTRS